jgi:hypothetical protein
VRVSERERMGERERERAKTRESENESESERERHACTRDAARAPMYEDFVYKRERGRWRSTPRPSNANKFCPWASSAIQEKGARLYAQLCIQSAYMHWCTCTCARAGHEQLGTQRVPDICSKL